MDQKGQRARREKTVLVATWVRKETPETMDLTVVMGMLGPLEIKVTKGMREILGQEVTMERTVNQEPVESKDQLVFQDSRVQMVQGAPKVLTVHRETMETLPPQNTLNRPPEELSRNNSS